MKSIAKWFGVMVLLFAVYGTLWAQMPKKQKKDTANQPKVVVHKPMKMDSVRPVNTRRGRAVKAVAAEPKKPPLNPTPTPPPLPPTP